MTMNSDFICKTDPNINLSLRHRPEPKPFLDDQLILCVGLWAVLIALLVT